MTTGSEAIASALGTSYALLKRLMDDMAPQDYLHRPVPKSNCAAWIIGHLTLSDRNVLKRLGAPLPELPEGFEQRFGKDERSAQATEFGDVSRILPHFGEHRRRLIEAVKSTTAEQLATPLDKPHPMFKTVGEMVMLMALHGALHAGQISTIRRSLGRPPVI
jgi:uncharacterized damage-inducible protein DinB